MTARSSALTSTSTMSANRGVADGAYSYNPFLTSAMKGLGVAVTDAIEHVAGGTWDTIGGTNGNYGLEEGDYVGLPTAETSWCFETFTQDEYTALVEKIRSGELVVDNNSDAATTPDRQRFHHGRLPAVIFKNHPNGGRLHVRRPPF